MNIINDNWSDNKKPYISRALIEVLLLPEEQPSLKQINVIKDLHTHENVERIIEGKFIDLSKEIEKIIKNLPILKDLKESIEDPKTNKQYF
ncbi:17621_t:CDS:2 [Dentiscutata erythropus]|uniref:17621_t:CDS:1 n=1 Tax=Dentiscutata erythropus TaxID=1348616 RepID=A0A9N9P5I9_9GLOM|nr:17621_t:CDS:2 [Dentiscutata erythropus]